MKINIDISQISKHIFFKFKKKREKQKITSMVVPYDFFAINEANIAEKIRNISYYTNYYHILYNYEFINIGEMDEKQLIKINDFNVKYLLFQYKNENYIEFNDYLLKLNTAKMVIHNMIESFSYLLDSLILLLNNNICFFNLSNENVVFNLNNGDKPLLINFRYSLPISKLNEDYIGKIMEKITDYTYKPLELHVLFYLIKNNLNTLTDGLIDQITENYIKQLSVLSLFSQNYNDLYKTDCVKSLKKYIDIPKSEIIADILEYTDKWDTYSLSLLYLHIIGNISRYFSLKGTFISNFVILLSRNIYPDPSKRESLIDTKDRFDKLFIEFPDWSFIHQLSNEKMKKILELIM